MQRRNEIKGLSCWKRNCVRGLLCRRSAWSAWGSDMRTCHGAMLLMMGLYYLLYSESSAAVATLSFSLQALLRPKRYQQMTCDKTFDLQFFAVIRMQEEAELLLMPVLAVLWCI